MTCAFQDLYQSQPAIAVRAPGRVDLMGSHTDYNDGWVLTLPIDRSIWMLARPRDDGVVRMASLNMGSSCHFHVESNDLNVSEVWGRYVQGVALELKKAGYPLTGCDAVLHGTIPLASGLSSSAALEAATATLFETLSGFDLQELEKALLCQRAENVQVGVNCGILDQYSSILGERQKALLLDCRSLTHRSASVPRDLRIVICNTRAPRQLSGSEYGDRRAQCEEGAAFFARLNPGVKALRDVSLETFEAHAAGLADVVARRSRFVIEENARVTAMATALAENDRESMNRLMSASFLGARDLFEISVPAMQAMMDAMQAAPGCVGSRQAGAGFGGCMIALILKEKLKAFCKATAANYESTTGLAPEIYPVQTRDGAGILRTT